MDNSDQCSCLDCSPPPLWRPSDAARERPPDPPSHPFGCRHPQLVPEGAHIERCIFCGDAFPHRTVTVAGIEVPIHGALVIPIIPASLDEDPDSAARSHPVANVQRGFSYNIAFANWAAWVAFVATSPTIRWNRVQPDDPLDAISQTMWTDEVSS